MVGVKELLVTVANTPVDTPVRVRLAGELVTVQAVEIRNGTLVIDTDEPEAPKPAAAVVEAPAQPVADSPAAPVAATDSTAAGTTLE